MGMVQTMKFDETGKVSSISTVGAPSEKPDCEVVHKCPRCGSYFYGRFEGFDGNPYYCGNCGFTYPALSIETLRSMHEKNGTLAQFDKGLMIEEVGSFDITVQ